MDGLFFEVTPRQGHLTHYFHQVDMLRPVLADHPGLLWIDRYRALDRADALLSHQLWSDEDAIIRWRRNTAHRRAQTAGRAVHFADYRIRIGRLIAEITDDQPGPLRHDAPPQAKDGLVLSVHTLGTAPVLHGFESVNHAGNHIALTEPASVEAGLDASEQAQRSAGFQKAQLFAIYRDYGMTDRQGAPSD